jgi:CNP1-like family
MHLKPALPPACFLATHSSALCHAACVRIMLLVLAALIGMPSVSHAQSEADEDADDTNKPWQEIAVQFPAAPREENLLPFEVSATATQSFAVDAKSLSVGTDGVVRYTMVSTSPSGAKTISYEGIRCQSFEKKQYAFGHADGSWSRSRYDRWEPIVRNAGNRQHAVLALDYVCESRMVAGNAERIVERIRAQRPLNSRSDRF